MKNYSKKLKETKRELMKRYIGAKKKEWEENILYRTCGNNCENQGSQSSIKIKKNDIIRMDYIKI